MRKTIVIALTAGVLAAAVVAPAEAAKKRKPKRTERVAEGAYTNPAVGVPGVVGWNVGSSFYEFVLWADETFMAVEITDDAGGAVTATLSQNTEPSSAGYEIITSFCGATAEPIAVTPGLAVRVAVYTTPGPGQPTCMGPATAGTIKATISNRP